MTYLIKIFPKYNILYNGNNSMTLFNKYKNLKIIIYDQIALNNFHQFYSKERLIDCNCTLSERKNCFLLKEINTGWKTLILKETFIKIVIRNYIIKLIND